MQQRDGDPPKPSKTKPKKVVIRRVFSYGEETNTTNASELANGRDMSLMGVPGYRVIEEATAFLDTLKPEDIVQVCDKIRERNQIVIYYRRQEYPSDGKGEGPFADRPTAG